MGECCLAAGRREARGRALRGGLGDRVSRKEFPHELTERRIRLVWVHIRRAAQETYPSTGSRLAMTKKTPAYGARAAKAPLAPMTIERRDPGSHDVEIEILYCGICHSDVHKVNNDWGTTHFPVVPGHEIVGRVLSLGSSASRFREGDPVGGGCLSDSGRTCLECRAGRRMSVWRASRSRSTASSGTGRTGHTEGTRRTWSSTSATCCASRRDWTQR